jgi:hypothetical protein
MATLLSQLPLLGPWVLETLSYRVLIVCMTQDHLFHTYDQKCSQITKCHNIEYNYYINNIFED